MNLTTATETKESMITIVDDEPCVRKSLSSLIRSVGYKAKEYVSAEDFLAENGQNLCNLAVTDVHMPGMSGLDLARHLGASGSKIPIILITARSEASLEARASAAGVACFLKKPSAIGDLIKCIEGALGA